MIKLKQILFEISTIMYHVSPSKYDAQIQKNGIKPCKNGYSYVWGDLYRAKWFKDWVKDCIHKTPYKGTVWQVNVNGLKLIRDPEVENMQHWGDEFEEDEFGEAYMIKGTIKPNRIVKLY